MNLNHLLSEPQPLSRLQAGQCARICKINGRNPLRQRFLDMGLVKDTLLEVIDFAPLGDPMRIQVRGYHLAIRKRDADLIEVTAL